MAVVGLCTWEIIWVDFVRLYRSVCISVEGVVILFPSSFCKDVVGMHTRGEENLSLDLVVLGGEGREAG